MAKMKYICPKHKDSIKEISYNQLKNGKGCKECGTMRRAKKRALSFESVKKAFKKNGMELLETEYVNSKSWMKYKCLKHPDKELRTKYNSVQIGYSCPYCGYEKLSKSGSDNAFWKGGVTEINDYLRSILKVWKREVIESNNYKCVITGRTGLLQVHHVKPFHAIRDEVLKEVNLPIYQQISEYTPDQLEMIVGKFKAAHVEDIGFPILKEIHQQFHREYGYTTTLKDFQEFKRKHKITNCESIK